jgi:hypothetical protein
MAVNIHIEPSLESNKDETIKQLNLKIKILEEEVKLLRRLVALEPKMKGKR